MKKNIKKVSAKYQEDTDKYEFIEDMIFIQRNSGGLIAISALQWLRRDLHFISHFFQSVIDDTESKKKTQDLSRFIESAYSKTLESYHCRLDSELYYILSRFSPTRQQFIDTLALKKPNKESQILADEWLLVFKN